MSSASRNANVRQVWLAAHLGGGGVVSSVALRCRNLLPFVSTLWSPTMPLLSCALAPGNPAASSITSSGRPHAEGACRRRLEALLAARIVSMRPIAEGRDA